MLYYVYVILHYIYIYVHYVFVFLLAWPGYVDMLAKLCLTKNRKVIHWWYIYEHTNGDWCHQTWEQTYHSNSQAQAWPGSANMDGKLPSAGFWVTPIFKGSTWFHWTSFPLAALARTCKLPARSELWQRVVVSTCRREPFISCFVFHTHTHGGAQPHVCCDQKIACKYVYTIIYTYTHTDTWSRRAPVFQCHVGLPMVKQPCKANSWWSWSRRLQAELACRPWYAWAPFKSYPLSWGYPNSWMVYNEKFCKKVMVWGVPRLEGHKNCKVAAAGSCFFSPPPQAAMETFCKQQIRSHQKRPAGHEMQQLQSLPVTSSHFQQQFQLDMSENGVYPQL